MRREQEGSSRQAGLTRGLLAMALAGTLSVPGTAKPVETLRYTYYTVSGDTAAEIYRAMLNRGPDVNGAKAYAATSATTTQQGKLLQEKSCSIVEYRLKLDFVVKLPRIRNEKVLPPADRRLWRQFSAFLKEHEDTHRRIWTACATDLEQRVKAIVAKSCKDVDRKAAQLWDRMRAACDRKHTAFDAAEQKRLLAHPFIKRVYRRAAGIPD